MNNLAADEVFKGLSAELRRHGRFVVDHWNASRVSLIDCGKALVAAKAALPHGDFRALYERLPFGKSTGAMLMRIARNLGDINVQSGTILPIELVVLDGLARLSIEDRQRMIAEGLVRPDMKTADLARFRRGQVVKELAAREQDPGPLNRGKHYTVVYADPAWKNEVWGDDSGHQKSPEGHYNTMTLDEIMALPVAEIAANDCALFLWTTANRAHWAMDVLAAWGFDYKTQMVWDKETAGTGRWVRDRHELLYIATRGAVPCPSPGDQAASLYREKKGRHSVKPDYFRDIIAGYFPGVAKIELFARHAANDEWDVWGNQAGGGKRLAVMAGGERVAVAGPVPEDGCFEGIDIATGEIGSWPAAAVERVEEWAEGTEG